ncbi:uncharacterized protein LOC127007814 [Eriocheir sinensis]|uniref:uncharacterized protein LOC127007814 n=1 Tax=Eriocheir sinensis TaxID=95602 RepID=UPI0021C9EB18|nr:uncharacterized protein LOC127007814 [Eriocheir sinensis]
MNKTEYLEKIDTILADERKFVKISKDPTEALKKKLNKFITMSNINSETIKINKVSGEYGMGYCYGTVKTHKPGNKLRPIISQIPTPTYNIAKKLCKILTPYVPTTYSLNSATDFLDILKSNNSRGIIASLDVESLFTNVPVERTINYIAQRVYHDDSTPPLDIPEAALRGLLQCCTKEAPFTCPRGQIYQQIDGVAMGSPLGVLLSNFFMGCIEDEVFKTINKPDIYCRYIDDIFIKTKNEEDMEDIRTCLQEISGLKFTIERSAEGKMPFLDVLVTQNQENFSTNVYVKPTNNGQCLNGRSECPQRYKDSTIAAYIRRAITHCSTWKEVHGEISRSTNVLLSNGFNTNDIEKQVKKTVDKCHSPLFTGRSQTHSGAATARQALAVMPERVALKPVPRRGDEEEDEEVEGDVWALDFALEVTAVRQPEVCDARWRARTGGGEDGWALVFAPDVVKVCPPQELWRDDRRE